MTILSCARKNHKDTGRSSAKQLKMSSVDRRYLILSLLQERELMRAALSQEETVISGAASQMAAVLLEEVLEMLEQ